MRNLDDVIKAYDVRGIYPDQIDEDLAYALGGAFVRVIGAAARDGGPGAVVIGHDMRPSGPDLVAAFANGVVEQGCDVIKIGLCSTDGIYFASGSTDLPGAMFTASHNPAEYNGIKLCRAGASPVSQDTGLVAMKEMVIAGVPSFDGPVGHMRDEDMLGDYAAYLRHLVPLDGIRPLKVVVDAGNGMAGFTAPAVFADLPLDIVPLFFELDGNFPNHEANPIDPANMVDTQRAVLAHGADLGLAFDGDADRCFVVDENGDVVDPSTLTALIASLELAKSPGSPVIHNLITSRAVPEVITEHGGTPVRTRVGHSFIKATMAETGAVFGGEHSGHFYFRDFWRADSGMLAALHVLSFLGNTPQGSTLSDLLRDFSRYSLSGEINTQVADAQAAIAGVRAVFEGQPGVTIDTLDGMTVSGDDWWFNLRPSNTEPLLRLNVEAPDAEHMARIRDEVLSVFRTA
ncbi:MAG: phosphomannomutase/phosphoglucomutase [Actinobacteria bacterium]|nr:phosphomannomutase/phosphoglucomutase [Actinomycetota bacterium]